MYITGNSLTPTLTLFLLSVCLAGMELCQVLLSLSSSVYPQVGCGGCPEEVPPLSTTLPRPGTDLVLPQVPGGVPPIPVSSEVPVLLWQGGGPSCGPLAPPTLLW